MTTARTSSTEVLKRWWRLRVWTPRERVGVVGARLRALGTASCYVVPDGAGRFFFQGFLRRATSRRRLASLPLVLGREVRVEMELVESCESDGTWSPVRVGRRLVVQRAAEPVPATSDRLVVRLLPRHGFGTGTHPTTRQSLEALEARAAGAVMADVGCGTGVLSIAAVLLGARQVLAVDPDAASIDTARANRSFNGIGRARLRVKRGGADRLAEMVTAPLDGVVCNTTAHLLREIVPGLTAYVRKGGWGVFGGIEERSAREIERFLAAREWAVERWIRANGWATVTAKRI